MSVNTFNKLLATVVIVVVVGCSGAVAERGGVFLSIAIIMSDKAEPK